jgi:hypothetical protein
MDSNLKIVFAGPRLASIHLTLAKLVNVLRQSLFSSRICRRNEIPYVGLWRRRGFCGTPGKLAQNDVVGASGSGIDRKSGLPGAFHGVSMSVDGS